ncbi:hypothetical protein GCM10023171_28240 [Microbacterium panaciterrae]|uniref:Uncharacterized protein n=1 Tax=Microbacterium panaciterrae TaxID=985759 RepID=A0ABP8PMY8_9MICO
MRWVDHGGDERLGQHHDDESDRRPCAERSTRRHTTGSPNPDNQDEHAEREERIDCPDQREKRARAGQCRDRRGDQKRAAKHPRALAFSCGRSDVDCDHAPTLAATTPREGRANRHAPS